MPLLRNRGHEKRRSLLNVLIVRYYVLEMACPIGLDCMLFLRSRTIGPHVFNKIGNGVPFDLKKCRCERRAGGRLRVHTDGVVDEVRRKSRILNLTVFQIPGQLMHNGTHHFKVAQFLRTDIR